MISDFHRKLLLLAATFLGSAAHAQPDAQTQPATVTVVAIPPLAHRPTSRHSRQARLSIAWQASKLIASDLQTRRN